MKQLRKSTVIECVASTSDRDVTNESLDIHGADISPLLEGRGFVNSDHRQNFESLVGRVVAAKKILKAEDCETPSQLKFYQELKKPFIWCKAELWNGHGHKEADAIASIYRFFMAKSEKPPIKVSVEGKTLERGKDGHLKRTLIKGIAITVHPCNRTTRTEVVEITKGQGLDPNSLVKSEDALIPSYFEVQENPLEKIYQLAVVARQLLRSAKENIQKSDADKEFELKSPKLLEQLKAKIADFKKSA